MAEASPEVAAVLAVGARAEAGKTMAIFSSIPTVDHEAVVAAILRAEARTSGVVTVVVARHGVKDPVAAARAYFIKAKLDRTALRNGVLLFVAPASRKFAVFGDRGVHEKCGDAFWATLTGAMTEYFKRGEFTPGLVHGIECAGSLLAEHFPRAAGDAAPPAPSVNEVD